MLPFTRPRTPIVYGALAVVLLVVLLVLPGRLVQLLWFDALGYAQIFWRTLGLQVVLFAGGFLLAALYIGANFRYVYKHHESLRWRGSFSGGPKLPDEIAVVLTPERLRNISIAATIFVAFFFGAHFGGRFEQFLRFVYGTPTGVVDPIFGRDISFYLLTLPYLDILQSAVMTLPVVSIMLLIGALVWMGAIGVEKGKLIAPRPVIRQLSVNLVVLILAWGAGYFLRRYELLYRSEGTVHGIGYIEHNIVIPALWAMVIASIVLAGLLLFNLRKARPGLLGIGVVGYIGVLILGLMVIPAVVQRFSVEPNELQLEAPYLENNIRFTRMAYGIDNVVRREYSPDMNLTYDDILDNEVTVRNIRLWDPRLLIQTFRQIQEIRTYYQFYEVDVDRYMIDGEMRQVMLAARELSQQLPDRADTWINRHMQYTHGYGITMNEVAEVGPEGTPLLLMRDLPLVSEIDLDVGNPAIYYGEHTPTYRIVNTDVPELAYPAGDENVYTHYDGRGGVQLSSFWRKLLFTIYLGDTNVILSDLIHDESRIQFWNRTRDRVRRIAPFLRLDDDPYLVVTADGLKWIQDAYTVARTYPYSEPDNRARLNYIRNSVKVVTDAYHGTVDFYVFDEDDPIINAYRSFYPDLFRDQSELPEVLSRHLRYPQDMFDIQVSKYTRYHMTTPQVFYNNEDLWTRPREHYGGREQAMQPYYLLTRLPDEEELDYLLMTPLTPEARDNMISWVAARSEPGRYGELVVFQLPKDRLIYGPAQVESRIDQDTEISQQLALWDQRGSRVIRGNLMVIPIETSFIYVEPVFLIADATEIPQLRRVIVSYGERVVMERTLDEAMARLFDGDIARIAQARDVDLSDLPADLLVDPEARRNLSRAQQAFNRAMESLRDGNFGVFGDRMDELERILNEAPVETPQPVVPDDPVDESL